MVKKKDGLVFGDGSGEVLPDTIEKDFFSDAELEEAEAMEKAKREVAYDTACDSVLSDRPKKEYDKQWIKVEFTDDELREMGNEMAQKLHEIAEHKDDLDTFRSEVNSQIKKLEIDTAQLASKIRNKSEQRNMKVLVVKDYRNKRVEYFLEDEQGWPGITPVKSRSMHPSEYQMTLDDIDQSDGIVKS